MEKNMSSVKLNYVIHKFSSYSSKYVPENIMVNNPTDQNSRWFTDSKAPPQYLVLKISEPAIVESIKFGKYIKSHVSDLKQFQVLGGLDDENFTELLTAGLSNDSSKNLEPFPLRHKTIEGLLLPVQYIKIVHLQSWGPAYNCTIWYVELYGINDPNIILPAIKTINMRKEEEAVRLILKHLRRRRYKDAFEALSRETGVRIEGHTQSRLWNALVENGDFESAENIMNNAIEDGEVDWYLSWQPYKTEWSQISPCSMDGEDHVERTSTVTADQQNYICNDIPCSDREWMGQEDSNDDDAYDPDNTQSIKEQQPCSSSEVCSCKPGPRGGHQLVVDSATGTLYLYGGWDGSVDLADLWSFDVASGRWTVLCRHSWLVGGPSPRSCHKMVLDPVHRRLYVLGRYLDTTQRRSENLKSELYAYDIARGEWALVCGDTGAVGGPRLVFDHQMCIDPETQTIYVFGGRELPATVDEEAAGSPRYSGLYAYHISTGAWELLLPEDHNRHAPLPRVGHSMLFHPLARRLYIFAGQRNREHLLDMWWWDVASGACGSVGRSDAHSLYPAAGFTQRATIDAAADEIYVLSGISKEKEKRVCNSLWVLSLARGAWSCAYRTEERAPAHSRPTPRFAHQLVYDAANKVHYLFGGNPGVQGRPQQRLDDLWALRLSRPPRASLAAKARWLLRKAQYLELVQAGCRGSVAQAAAALHHLRHRLRDALDPHDHHQQEQFRKLATMLFAGAEGGCGGEEGAGGAAAAVGAVTLTPALTRSFARRRCRALSERPSARLAESLHAVLGADDVSIPAPEPFDDVPEPQLEPEPSDIGDVSDDMDDADADTWDARASRISVYDALCKYFRPSVVPPTADVTSLVKL